jgi:hypothetical protein
MSGAGSAEELEDLLRLGQGCIERSQGLEGLKLPLSAPGGCAARSYISEGRGGLILRTTSP